MNAKQWYQRRVAITAGGRIVYVVSAYFVNNIFSELLSLNKEKYNIFIFTERFLGHHKTADMKRLMLRLSICCVCVSVISAFDVPILDDIRQLFGDFVKKVKSSTDETEKPEELRAEEVRPKFRRKRQNTNIGDESPLPYEIRASSLPMNGDGSVNTRYMPTIGNGYLGATIYDDYVHMNGVYNGAGGDSHRAEIPALLMSKIRISNSDIDRRASRKYTLSALEGYFEEFIDCEFGIVRHKTYLHQKYIRMFVADTFAELKEGANGGLMLKLDYPSINRTQDFNFGVGSDYQGGSLQFKGSTKYAEPGQKPQSVTIFTTYPLKQISVTGTQKVVNFTQIMTVDRVDANARMEFDEGQRILRDHGSWKLFQLHSDAWRKSWNLGRLEVEGSDTQLMKAVWFAQYYLLSSLPAEFPYLAPSFNEPFYGLGRTSLAKGTANKDYQGHVMYDNEFYMLPAVLPFHPKLAKNMLRYRSATAAKAAENAKLFGGEGYHYPWRSGSSGVEVSPDACPPETPKCHWNHIYVTAAVSYGIRLYYSLTRDHDYMKNTYYAGCDVSREIAKFLAGQAVYNPEHGRYDMNDITGPDEFHPNVNNNAFTLCAVSLAIHWARYFSCLCERNERDEVPDEYIQKALYLNLPYDNVQRLHYEHEGYNPGDETRVKQADTIMLNYPLNWNYSVDIMKNDLDFYETLIADQTPAMTWSWFTIGYKWVNEPSKTKTYFLKSYQDYIIQPFKVWTEFTERNPTDQAAGNVNFLPGMGAFLQSVMYGFAGFRIRPDQLEIHNPMPPPTASKIYLHGFQYLGSNLSFTITADKTTIKVQYVSPQHPLILRRNQTGAVEESLTTGATIEIQKSVSNGFFIYPQVSETCEHPRDYIYMPWGYSPWIDSAPHVHSSSLATVLMITLVTLLSRL